jgi:large subunit ribosomal protein L6
MSRIGKKPVTIPSGVEATFKDGVVTIKKGSQAIDINTYNRVKVDIKDGDITFDLVGDTAQNKAFWGTYRSLINNAIIGLDKGFSKSLEINGVGFRAAVKGDVLELQLGYSHPINHKIPNGIDISVDKNIINIKGSSKQLVGQTAAIIRGYRKPEPYKGKGVKYTDEHIVRKAGKTAS